MTFWRNHRRPGKVALKVADTRRRMLRGIGKVSRDPEDPFGTRVLGAFSNTWTATLNSDDSGLENLSHRQIIPAADITTSGDACRVTFVASTLAAFTVDNASIGKRTGVGVDTVDTPVELLFSGASGFAISAGATIVSDTLIFPIDETADYIVIVDYSAANAAPRRLDPGAGCHQSPAAANSYDQATVVLYIDTSRTYFTNKIEVASYS